MPVGLGGGEDPMTNDLKFIQRASQEGSSCAAGISGRSKSLDLGLIDILLGSRNPRALQILRDGQYHTVEETLDRVAREWRSTYTTERGRNSLVGITDLMWCSDSRRRRMESSKNLMDTMSVRLYRKYFGFDTHLVPFLLPPYKSTHTHPN
jgi:hypothetical protein